MPVDGEHVISSRQALTLDRLPESMIVVGSGAIGSEFAWFYAALGVKVTIIEYMPLHDAPRRRGGVEDHGARVPQTARDGADLDHSESRESQRRRAL